MTSTAGAGRDPRDAEPPAAAAAAAAAAEAAHAPPLGALELLVVAAVWGFYGLLNLASGRLDARTPGDESLTLAQALVNPAAWAALTALVMWAGRRIPPDRAFWRRHWVLVLVLGVLAANVSDALSDAWWDAAVPGDAETGRRFRPSLRNLSWLDDFGVVVAALAATVARGYVLRARAREDGVRRREAALEARSASLRADAALLEAQLAEARLDALRRQLDPHFLFNTLNAVSALVERDPRGVRRMIEQLGDLLRHSMDDATTPEIPLRRELALLERYLDIMRLRFDDQLQVATRADPRALDALVPNLILQPLVENAIRHGVEQRAEGGRVEVEVALDGDALVLRVWNDGPPPAPDAATSGGGVGLRNTAARLAQLYGAAQRLTLAPDARGGTLAEVRLPHRTAVAPRPAAQDADREAAGV